MTEGPPCPTFDEFYRATHHGNEPFPWQARLAGLVAGQGWPSEIGIPTGLGKTACLDIAVWALAAQAHLPPTERTAPTRIWYVVNRRLLVDTAADHAETLAGWLTDPASLPDTHPEATAADIDAVAAVAARLRSVGALGSERGPLHVTRLRGGADLGARVPDPSQPAVVLATVPMFASRWFFRGYGTSTSMRPVDAALAGTDCVVLLDEAHLAQPLADLTGPAAQCDVGDPTLVVPAGRARPTVVTVTATGQRSPSRFDLDAADFADPVIDRRVNATKPTRLSVSDDKNLPRDLASETLDLLTAASAPSSCVVFTNSPGRARDTHRLIETGVAKAGLAADVVLITGRMREHEADTVRSFLLDPATRSTHLVVVATQTLEVGADVDFEHLVTESAGVRALVQRFGRLNRLGTKPDATAVICHPAGTNPRSIYGDEPDEVWDRLTAAAAQGPLDLGLTAITKTLGEPSDTPPRTAELLPSHLWEWAKTTVPPPGEAPIEPFIESLDDQSATVTVVWRAWIPDTGSRGALEPRLRGEEAVDVPISEARAWLDPHGTTHRPTPDRTTLEPVAPARIRPGDQLVVAASSGGYDQHGWDPHATSPVLDVSPLAAGVLVLEHDVLANLVDLDAAPAVTAALHALGSALDDDDPADDEIKAAAAAVLDALADATPHPWITEPEWAAFLHTMSNATPAVPVDGPPRLVAPRRPGQRATVRSDAFDELSLAQSQLLDDHLATVGDTAALIGQHIGLNPDLVEAVRLAGAFHDQGKTDTRFQRWLDPTGRADNPVAKSTMTRDQWEQARMTSGWPRGGRHETLSARLVTAAIAHGLDAGPDPDLLIHLVATHHGHGRPSLPTVDDPAPTATTATVAGIAVTVSGDLSAGEWDQPARFRRLCERYGYWGLALLEAIVRQADHAASAQTNQTGTSTSTVEVA